MMPSKIYFRKCHTYFWMKFLIVRSRRKSLQCDWKQANFRWDLSNWSSRFSRCQHKAYINKWAINSNQTLHDLCVCVCVVMSIDLQLVNKSSQPFHSAASHSLLFPSSQNVHSVVGLFFLSQFTWDLLELLSYRMLETCNTNRIHL